MPSEQYLNQIGKKKWNVCKNRYSTQPDRPFPWFGTGTSNWQYKVTGLIIHFFLPIIWLFSDMKIKKYLLKQLNCTIFVLSSFSWIARWDTFLYNDVCLKTLFVKTYIITHYSCYTYICLFVLVIKDSGLSASYFRLFLWVVWKEQFYGYRFFFFFFFFF